LAENFGVTIESKSQTYEKGFKIIAGEDFEIIHSPEEIISISQVNIN
jgi:hypothetical protein